MPLIPLLFLGGGFGAGYFLGVKTTDVLKIVIVGGVVYYVVKKRK